MKTLILKYFLSLITLTFIFVSCTKDFDEINTDPNRSKNVPTVNLIGTAQKGLTDDIFDEWFSGRQGLLWSQYWAQRNYTSEDRFSIRQGTNNTYFRLIYTDMADLQEIIHLASDESKKIEIISKYGDPDGQIAVAKILKAYVFQLLVSTYGDLPYEQAFQPLDYPSPAYSSQKVIFMDLFKTLKEAADYLEANPGLTVFTSGDLFYSGDGDKWAKFANSLRLKLAVRLSEVEDEQIAEARQLAIQEASDNVFSSNDDNAGVTYKGETQLSNAPMYNAFYTDGRNDFTVTAQFVDLLKGINDTLNNKVNPFEGITDPRIAVWVPPSRATGEYRGMPYGLSDKDAGGLWSTSPRVVSNFKYPFTQSDPNIVLRANANVCWMDYAEVCFILSELNGWDQTWYEEGVRASLERWGINEGVEEFISSLPPANAERVMTQKYIALYMNGYEAWAEWRRTDFPKSIVQVGEKTGPIASGDVITFSAIVGDGIPRRLTYPVQEYSINRTSVEAAANTIGSDDFATKLIWDK